MELTIHTFIIVCPLVFLAGMVDAIAGGGGLISLPAYLIAGLPPHAAVATNKMSSPFGTALATYRFARNHLINVRLAVPSVMAAIIGSFIGSHVSLMVPEKIAAFVIGCYDGFYGPGTGTFLIIAFTVFARLSIKTANAQAKVINLTTNITSLIIFLLNGQVIISLGLAAAACNMLGGYIGAGLVMKNGARIAKPSILFVLVLLGFKVAGFY